MSTTVSDIIAQTKALVETKQAEFRKKAAIAGGDGSDYPGAECDKPVAAAAGNANAEIKEELPEGGTSASGAADAEKLESGHAKDSTQSCGHSVTKKPADSADAMAKRASQGTTELANSLMERIRSHQEKVASAEKEAESCGSDGKKPAKKAEMKGDKSSEKSKDKSEPEKRAEDGNSIELTTDVLSKIASVILSTEEGIAFTEQQLTKAAGAEAAVETMQFLQKQAAYEAGAADAEAMIYNLYMQKQAEEQYAAEQARYAGQMGYTEADLEKAAQAMADEILATAGEEDAGGLGTGEEGGDVMGDIADGGDLGDISPEELQQAIAMMVSEGSLDEATASAILEALGAGGEAMPPEAGAAEAEMAAGAPVEEEGEEVTAAALEEKIASAIKRIRKQSK